jgi:hypothetical protein
LISTAAAAMEGEGDLASPPPPPVMPLGPPRMERMESGVDAVHGGRLSTTAGKMWPEGLPYDKI